MKKPRKTKLPKAVFDKRNMPMMHADLNVRENSFDEKTNSVEIIFSTGSDVRRYSWAMDGYFIEQLSMKPEDVRLERFKSGNASLLKDHRAGVDYIIGRITDARIEGGVGYARVELSENPDHAGIVGDIKAGNIRAISVGYAIHELKLIEEREDEPDIYRATDWEPFEVSIVAVPADAASGVRSEQQDGVTTACLIERATPKLEPTGDVDMETEEEKRIRLELEAKERKIAEAELSQKRAAEIKAAEEKAVTAALAKAEKRRADIDNACDAFSVDAEERKAIIASGDDINVVRAQLQDKLAEKSKKIKTNTRISPDAIGDGQKRGDAMVNALLHRLNPSNKLEDHGREYRGMSMVEMGKETLEANGISARGSSKQEIAGLMLGKNNRSGGMSTSDFTYVLSSVSHSYIESFQAFVTDDWKKLSEQTTLKDFNPETIMKVNKDVTFSKLTEGGEYKRVGFSDSGQQWELGSYGLIVPISRRAIINDSLGVFADTAKVLVNGGHQMQHQMFWDLIIKNANLGDGVALFHANHKNLIGTGTVIAVSSMSAMRKALMLQVQANSKLPMRLRMKYMVVPVELETAAQMFLTQITATKTADINPFANSGIEIIAEPLLDLNSTISWYGFTDPRQLAGIKHAYLEGTNGGMYIESDTNWDTDAYETKGRIDFAVAVVEHRAIQKNKGANPS